MKITHKKPEANRVNCYTRKEFEALADSVNVGMSVEKAEEIIQTQHERGATGEGYFWVRIKESATSTIRIKRLTIKKLKDLKKAGYEKGMDPIINKLIEENPQSGRK